jgi:hypothetical protein
VLFSVPKEISGFATLTRSHLAPYDTIHSVIRCEDNSHGVFDLSYALPPKAKDIFDLTFTGRKWLQYALNEANDGKNVWKVIVHLAEGEEEAVAWKEKSGVIKELEYVAQLLHGKGLDKGLPKKALLDVVSFKPRSRLKAMQLDSLDSLAVTGFAV